MSVWKADFGRGDIRYLVVEVGPKDRKVKSYLRQAYETSQGKFGALANLDKHAKDLRCVAAIPKDLAHELKGFYREEKFKEKVESFKESVKKAKKIADDLTKALEL